MVQGPYTVSGLKNHVSDVSIYGRFVPKVETQYFDFVDALYSCLLEVDEGLGDLTGGRRDAEELGF